MAEKLLTLIQDTTGDEIYPNIKEDNIPPSVRDKLQEIDGKQNQIIASTINPFSITVDNTGHNMCSENLSILNGILKLPCSNPNTCTVTLSKPHE